jgi:hypothetical protein
MFSEAQLVLVLAHLAATLPRHVFRCPRCWQEFIDWAPDAVACHECRGRDRRAAAAAFDRAHTAEPERRAGHFPDLGSPLASCWSVVPLPPSGRVRPHPTLDQLDRMPAPRRVRVECAWEA